jgi:hypothetical protein
MIPRRLRCYWESGVNTTTQDISDYSNWLSSQKANRGPSTQAGSGRPQSVGGGMNRTKVGPATGIYDPEWASWLAEENA